MPVIQLCTDEHIDSAVVNGLHRRGVEVLTRKGAGLRTKSDAEHFEFFITSGYVLYTHDGGCVGRAAEITHSGKSQTGVVYCHHEKYGIGEQIRRLKALAESLSAEEMVDQVIYL